MSLRQRVFEPITWRIQATAAMAVLMTTAFSSCGQQNTYNDDAARAYAQEANLKRAQLAPAVGEWCGTMHMNGGGDFDVQLSLGISNTTVQAPSSQDPTLIAQQPRLQGAMAFPIIRDSKRNSATNPDLIAATGDGGTVQFNSGDYLPQNDPQVVLTFQVQGSTTNVSGNVQGNIVDGKFSGKWTSIGNREVGSFKDLKKTTSENCDFGGAS